MGELIYDGDCAFCTRSKNWLMAHIDDGSTATASQTLAPDRLAELGLTEHDVATSVYWVSDRGRCYRGARGIGHALRHAKHPWRAVGWVLAWPPVAVLGGVVYRIIARYRHRMPGGSAACALPAPDETPDIR